MYHHPYLDASVWICASNPKERPENVDIAKHILDDCKAGRLRIVACSWVAVEFVGKKKLDPPMTDERAAWIDSYLLHDFIDWVELSLDLALEARQYIRKYGLSNPDAVHLAAAKRGKADELLTFDPDFPIGELEGIVISRPYWEGQEKLALL